MLSPAMVKPFSFFKLLLRDARMNTEVIYPWQLPSIMRKHIITGAMGTIYFVLVVSMYLVPFGTKIEIQYWQWGLLSAATSFVLVLQLLSAYLVSRTGNRRSLWFYAAFAGRLVRAFAIAGAFVLFGFSGSASRIVFLLLLVAASCFEAIGDPPWFSWLADIIPQKQHGRFWGRRNAWIALANLLVVVPIGYAMDRASGDWAMTGLMVVFGFGLILGMLDLFIHRTIPEPPMAMPPRRRFWHEVKMPLLDPNFRPWLVFNAFWTFSVMLGGSLATVYIMNDLKISNNYTGGSLVLIVLPLMLTILTGKLLGRMVDKAGVKRTLLWGYALWATIPLFWIPATPSTAMFWLGLSAVATIGVTAGTTASLKLITRQPPTGHVAMYVAVSTCTGALAGGFGPLIGGFVLQALKNTSWQIGGFTVIGFHVLFIASFVLRSCALLAIGRIPEPVERVSLPAKNGVPSPVPTA